MAKTEKKLTNMIEKKVLCPKHVDCEDDVCRHRLVHEHDPAHCDEFTDCCPQCEPHDAVKVPRAPRVEMPECKLKIRLVLFDRAVAMQVLYQDPRFLNRPSGKYAAYRTYNGLCIISDEGPALAPYGDDVTDVYLRGRADEEDSKVTIRYFETNKERDDYTRRLKEALRDWAENAPEFGKKEVRRMVEVIQEDEVFEI